MAVRHRATRLTAAGAVAPAGEAVPAIRAAEKARPVGIAAFLYSTSLLVFLVGPPLLPGASAPYPLLRWGELLDLFAPPVVIVFAWLLFQSAGAAAITAKETIAFVALAALWVEGHSLHLAANAIGHYLPLSAAGTTVDLVAAAELTHFLDEVLSHYVLHAAILGLSALVGWRSLSASARGRTEQLGGRALLPAAVVYGFVFFAAVVEGNTALVMVPLAAALSIGLWFGMRGFGRPAPGAKLFVVGYAVTILLVVTWAMLNGWTLPEFSDLKLIA
jgi:hypothetical protein